MRPISIRPFLLSAILLAAATGTPRAQFAKVGPEFQVNTYTTHTQGEPSIAVDAAGNFVVVWESFGQDGSGFGVFGRRFDKNGAPQGGEFQVNSWTTGNQYSAIITTDPTGGFVVLWESYGQDGSGFGVFGRRFDKNGAPQGTDFQINNWTTSHQIAPSLAMDARGNFVVAWGSDGQDGSGYGVFGRRYDRDGAPRGPEFPVNSTTTYEQLPRKASITSGPEGDFIVVWTSTTSSGTGSRIFGRRFGTDGSPVSSEFLVNTFTGTRQRHPSVLRHPSGQFMVIWESFLQDTSSWGVYSQHYNAAGVRQGGEFSVNTESYSGQITGNLGVDDEGRFVVVWYSFLQDGSDQGIFGQRYASNGAPVGAEFQINSYTTGEQNLPWVAVDHSGRFVVAWYSFAQDGSDLGIFSQRYACSPAAGSVADMDVTTYDGGANLEFTWANTSGATDYVILEDVRPYGGFGQMLGTATSGSAAYSVAAPAGNLVYFRVAARNPICGLGPIR